MTAEELLAMPDDGFHHYELVKGELLTMSPAGYEHGTIAALVAGSLVQHVKKHKLGRVAVAQAGYVLERDPDTVREPDISFVAAERDLRTREFFPGAPDLAVEVLSPSDRATAVNAKVRQYLAAGTRMVVVIEPEKQSATIHTPTATTRLNSDDSLFGGEVVPGWSLPLRELFG